MRTVPSVRFVLPGRWVQADLDDPVALGALTDLLPDDRHRDGEWAASLRAAGAQTVLIRPRSTPATVIVFVWPTGEERGDSSLEGVRTRLGIEGEVVPHEAGYTTLRYRPAPDSSQEIIAYAVAHPDTGRLLVVRCTAFEHPFKDYMLRDFDLAAGDLTWIET